MSSDKHAMLAVRSPSIAQQRVVLVVFLAIIAAAAWWQHGGSSSHSVQKFSMRPLTATVEQLDFTSAEAAWSGLTIDPQGNLQIDALTETALSDAVALLQEQPSANASEQAMARIALLLEKQFGAASQQIMALLPTLKHYKEIERRFWEENGARNPPPHAELFQLQDKLFGATLAKQLFSTQRRLANFMLASQTIQNDATLTQAEKDRKLTELQSAFDNEGATQ